MSLARFREWLLSLRWSRSEFAPVWLCAYCRDHIPVFDLTLDHRMPIAQGGLTNAENLTPSCKRCNEAKGNLSADAFHALVACADHRMTPADKTELFRRLRGGFVRRGKWAGKGGEGRRGG